MLSLFLIHHRSDYMMVSMSDDEDLQVENQVCLNPNHILHVEGVFCDTRKSKKPCVLTFACSSVRNNTD